MGRSVNYLNNAEHIAYKDVSWMKESYDWEDCVNDIIYCLEDAFPSLEQSDEWDNNETQVILKNRLAKIGVSEYCGLMSISIAPLDSLDVPEELAINWINRIADKFDKIVINEFVKQGTMSNGVGVYNKI